MKIAQIGFDEPSVVILGAGATRGASFVNDLTGALPPLDSDFFTQVQRIGKGKPEQLLNLLIQDTVDIFGNNFKLTMEGFLTHVEHLANVFDDYRSQGRPGNNPFRPIRDRFLQVLAALLDESIGRQHKCEYHKCLIETLSAKDTILSFNYDWLIDRTLKEHGKARWNPEIGYGVEIYTKGKKGHAAQYWSYRDSKSSDPARPRQSITLLKLHGAMNWFPVPPERNPPRLRLRERWWHQKGDLKFEIAPPEWNKPIRSGIYKPLWRTARQTLQKTKCLVFIGYSLPPTDLPAQALLMVDAKHRAHEAPPLDLLVLVNPDQEARKRIRQVVIGRINNKTRVLTFDYFKEFAQFLAEKRLK